MGGFGSGVNGRRSRRRATDDVFRVDIRAWHRAGLLRPGRIFALSLGERAALVTAGWKSVTISGAIVDTLHLVDTPCQFGGTRPWALCRCGRRAAVLFVHGGSLVCRRCADLVYRSQRESPAERAMRRARAIRVRLGGDGNLLAPFPARPSRMRKPTYERLRGAAEAAKGSAYETVRGMLEPRRARTT